jgi:hypothetical protein
MRDKILLYLSLILLMAIPFMKIAYTVLLITEIGLINTLLFRVTIFVIVVLLHVCLNMFKLGRE